MIDPFSTKGRRADTLAGWRMLYEPTAPELRGTIRLEQTRVSGYAPAWRATVREGRAWIFLEGLRPPRHKRRGPAVKAAAAWIRRRLAGAATKRTA